MPANTKTTTEGPVLQSGGKKGKSAAFAVITFFSVIVIIALILGGTFYFTIHNNVNGLADRYRKTIQGIPVARMALPVAPDPLDPQYLTAGELKNKYNEFRETNADLQKQLDEAARTIQELRKDKDEAESQKTESDKAAQDMKARQAELDEKQKQLANMKTEIDSLIASGNKEGLKQYYETLDPETAQKVYSEVVRQQQADAGTKKFASVYAAMDESAAAQIFEQLGDSQIDMIARTLMAMSKENSAGILEAMTPDFAAKVTRRLDELYRAG